MPKSSSFFVCSNCAYEATKWLGQCPSCNEWNTFEQIESSIIMKEIGGEKVELGTINSLKDEKTLRTSTGFGEFDRVMGGGLVAGEVILISGEPGIGKSTFLLHS